MAGEGPGIWAAPGRCCRLPVLWPKPVSIAMPIIVLILAALGWSTAPEPEPVRIGVVGLVHSHVHWILGREDLGDIQIVGIAEPNRDLARRFAERHGFDMGLVYDTAEEMLRETRPEAVTVFTSIRDHMEVTRLAARYGVHVMVEKPLAISVEHARIMKAAADSAGIHLLTNYETTWYASVHETRRIAERGDVGPLRKIVVHDGHPGPIEIGVNREFSEWLTDPAENGGGAVIDFGCYGANLITWLMHGQRPESVTAVLQTFKPDRYSRVDDEATIILTYPGTQGIIQASWNWPFDRKDMEVYGATGYVHADNDSDLRVRLRRQDPESKRTAEPLPQELSDPFSYLAAVVRGAVDPAGSLSSLSVNMTVTEILGAAIRSAETGETVELAAD